MNSTNFARKACALLICASLSVAAFAQSQVIKGKIVDENGDPLVGVTIQEKGTNNGTITDMDGNYSIMAGARSTLQIRYVGYQQEDIAVNGKNIINVNLKSELEDLDEVVVVGNAATPTLCSHYRDKCRVYRLPSRRVPLAWLLQSRCVVHRRSMPVLPRSMSSTVSRSRTTPIRRAQTAAAMTSTATQ